MQVSADAQGLLSLVAAVERLKDEGSSLSGRECANIATAALEECVRIRETAAPIPLQDISDLPAGEHVNQPANVVYTMTVTKDGDAKQWISDRITRADQFAWLHEVVLDASHGLAERASGSSGLN